MYYYVISFNDIVNHDFPNARNISSVHEGENDVHSFEVSHLVSDLDYIWPIYKFESGFARVGDVIVLNSEAYTNDYINVPLPDCLLQESGRLKIQILGTDSPENIDTIFDAYASGEFVDKIAKSDVYEFYVMDSLNPLEELVGPGGISEAAKEYLTDLVDELIAEGIHIDDELSTSSVNAVQNKVVTAAINEKADTDYVDWKLGDKVDNGNGTVYVGLAVGTNPTGSYNNGKAFSVGTRCLAANNSAAVGTDAQAGQNSLAVGNAVSASTNQLVVGENNIPDTNHDYYFIVGNGNNSNSNAHTIDKNGNAWFKGAVKVGGTSYSDSNAKELATKEYVDSVSPFVTPIILFGGTPQSGTFTGTISGSALRTAINNGKIPLFALRYDITSSDPTDSSIRVQRFCPCLILDKDNNNATVMYYYNGTTYLVTIAWVDSSSDQYTLTFNSIPTTSEMNTAIQNAIGNAIGGSY